MLKIDLNISNRTKRKEIEHLNSSHSVTGMGQGWLSKASGHYVQLGVVPGLAPRTSEYPEVNTLSDTQSEAAMF